MDAGRGEREVTEIGRKEETTVYSSCALVRLTCTCGQGSYILERVCVALLLASPSCKEVQTLFAKRYSSPSSQRGSLPLAFKVCPSFAKRDFLPLVNRFTKILCLFHSLHMALVAIECASC